MVGSQSNDPSRPLAKDRLTRAVFFGLVGLVALAPLPFASNRPWSWSLLALMVGVLLLLWALAARRDPDALGAPWEKMRVFAAMFGAIVAWILIQAIPYTPEAWHHPLWRETALALGTPLRGAISLDPQRTLDALMRLMSYAGVFWLALQLGGSSRRARALVWSVACAGFAYSLYGLVVEFTGIDKILWYDRWAYTDSLSSTFVNRNSFATYAGLALMATLGLLLDEARLVGGGDLFSRAGLRAAIEGLTGRLGALAVMALVIGSALLLTDSRGGMVSALVGLFVLALVYVAAPGGRLLPGLLTIAGIVIFAAAILTLSGEVAIYRLDRSLLMGDDRPAVYRLVLDAIRDNPWRGTGYGTFEEAFSLIRDSSVTSDLRYDKAHNSYLEFALETGVPAFLAMIAILGGLTVLCLVGVWRRRRRRLCPRVAVAASGLVAVHSLVDFSVQIPAVAVAFAALLGVGVAQSWSRRKSAAATE